MMQCDKIYLDNAATTKISDEVFDVMLPYFKDFYGNPSSIYSSGRQASIAIRDARSQCAGAINAEPSEIYFTSGGSESDNWAIYSTAYSMLEKGKNHIVTSAFEHHAVLNTLKFLEKKGFRITYLPVYRGGIVKAADLKAAITENTALVTIMYVNNEIGTIQPIKEIGALCRERGVVFHTDAVQAAPHLYIDVKKDNIDLMSVSGHKLHAPKGVGLLYCRNVVKLTPMVRGGGQERGSRAGTENTAGIVALAEAMVNAEKNKKDVYSRHLKLSEYIIEEIMKMGGVSFNGDIEKRVPSIMNFSFDDIEGESLLLQLDLRGIAAGSGSACTSGNSEPSHVLRALGLSCDAARRSLRISMSRYTTYNEINIFLTELSEIIKRLRELRL